MTEQLKPCPFCGHVGLDFEDGSTHRWGVASCGGCGASTGEVRRNYPDDDKWHAAAIEAWNRRAPGSTAEYEQWVKGGRPVAQQAEPDWVDGVPHWTPELIAKVKRMTAELDEPKQPQAEPTDSMGIPLSCGKPLCSPGDHHPLCKLHKKQQAEVVEVPNTFKLPGESDDQWLDRITGATRQQAEAVPSSDLNPDEGDPVTLWAEIWRLREAVKGPDGYATWQDAATAERIRRVRAESKQAEEAKAVPTHDDTDLIKQMLEALRSCSGVSHWPALIPTINAARKRLEAPQQAEAVPPDVVRDAERYRWWRDNACRKPAMVAALLGPLIYPQDIDTMIDEAIAQQKGQP